MKIATTTAAAVAALLTPVRAAGGGALRRAAGNNWIETVTGLNQLIVDLEKELAQAQAEDVAKETELQDLVNQVESLVTELDAKERREHEEVFQLDEQLRDLEDTIREMESQQGVRAPLTAASGISRGNTTAVGRTLQGEENAWWDNARSDVFTELRINTGIWWNSPWWNAGFTADTVFAIGSGIYSHNWWQTVSGDKFRPKKYPAGIYQTQREGQLFGYAIPVVNGPMKVKLHFAELTYSAAGQRVFNIEINDVLVKENLDLFAETGGKGVVYIHEEFVLIRNGEIKIKFIGVTGPATVAAVEVMHKGCTPFLQGNDYYFANCNVHIHQDPSITDGSVDSTGNLIVGHNECDSAPLNTNQNGCDRSGSHNLIVGEEHQYPNKHGFVTGMNNKIQGTGSVLLGGRYGTIDDATAPSQQATIVGGEGNVASAHHATIVSGAQNLASGEKATIFHGQHNEASGEGSSVHSSIDSKAEGLRSNIHGTFAKKTTGADESVAGRAELADDTDEPTDSPAPTKAPVVATVP